MAQRNDLRVKTLFAGFVIALIVTGVPPALGHPTQFPGLNTQLKSPNGDFMLFDKDNDSEPYHSLYLKILKTGIEMKIEDFNRSVTVEWSPNSSKYFINNNNESTQTDCNVQSVYKNINIDVLTLAEQKFGVNGGMAAGHLYIICKAWKNDRLIDGVVEGYGGSNGETIDHPFELNVESITISNN